MGLDMYLSKKIYVWSNDRGNLKITGADMPVRGDKIKYIVEEAGYWRKANAIHQWFVTNVQDGADDCKEYYVSSDQMRELLAIVNRVLAASELVDGDVCNGWTIENGQHQPIVERGKIIKDATTAQELLPTRSGFFFGSTDYDQYYLEDLKLTKQIIEEALEEGGDYYYSSSW